jgi:D-glycero-D-manno-heptose 1,7-bisphosphate phosphatase
VGIDDVTDKPAVFLDRDGVINRAIVRDGHPFAPRHAADLEVLPGVPDALVRLKQAGFALIVVTNQPDVARGTLSKSALLDMNERLTSLLPLDEVRVCCHDDADGCECRKPKPGLLTRPPLYDLGRSVMVGDRWRDIEAGRRAGCGAVVLIDYGYDEALTAEPDIRLGSLSEAADWIVARMVNA